MMESNMIVSKQTKIPTTNGHAPAGDTIHQPDGCFIFARGKLRG
jgi:hypothetical protein